MNSDRFRAASVILSGLLLAACATTQPTSMPDVTRPTIDGPPQKNPPAATEPLAPSKAGAVPRTRVGTTADDTPQLGSIHLSGLPDSAVDVDTMVAHFIDVGQGDATLLEFQCGAVLIDTGGESTPEVSGPERLGAYLEEFFLRRPDLARTLALVVLSHPHADHTAGVQYLLEASPAITINNVLDNGAVAKGSGIAKQKNLQAYARDSGAGYVGIAEADIPTVAGVTNSVIDPVDCRNDGGVDPLITAVWGRVDVDEPWANNANNDSVVLRVDFGQASFLFTGDLEEKGIEAMLSAYAPDPSILDADVLKVAHHGSRNGTTAEFVAAITPKLAIAPAGDSTLSQSTFSAYSFAHPHQDAVGMLLDTAHGGVSLVRPPKLVRVGVKGRSPDLPPKFATRMLDRAIYSNGWDGNLAVTVRTDGTLSVEAGF